MSTRAVTPQRRLRVALPLGRFLPGRGVVAVGGTILLVVTLISIFAPQIAVQDPLMIDVLHRAKPPSLAHPFGTDALGRDVFSRTVYGGRVSLTVGLGVAVVTTIFGLMIGIFSGFYRAADAVIMRIMDGLMSIPAILLAIALVSINRPSPPTLIMAIAIPEIPRMVRLVRSVVLIIREQTYIEAAIASGTRPLRMFVRHVLPNAMAPVIVQATFVCALAIILEATLSFLGIGTPPEVPSWGNIIAGGRTFIRTAPWILLYPGLLLGVTVLSVNLMGDGLRDLLDPRMSREPR